MFEATKFKAIFDGIYRKQIHPSSETFYVKYSGAEVSLQTEYLYSLQNSYVKILTLSAMVLGGGPLEGHEDGLHMNRISGFIKETPATLSRLSYEVTERR